jgi:hypothetical protein
MLAAPDHPAESGVLMKRLQIPGFLIMRPSQILRAPPDKALPSDANQLDFWLRLEGFYRPLKTSLQKPLRPAPIIVIFTPLLDAGFGDLEAVTRNRFE